MTRRWKYSLWATALCLALAAAGLAVTVGMIRLGVSRFSEQAVSRFGGERTHALMATVDCESCTLQDRNHAVWALGQLEADPALATLKKHYTGAPCEHARRLCQHELRKAIRMIEARERRGNPAWQLLRAMHRPRE